MRLPTPGQTPQDLARSRFAQAERLERELADVHETWSPARHPFMRRWCAGELWTDELQVFAGEHYHVLGTLADVAGRAARLADGMLGEQLEHYAARQQRALQLWVRFAAATGWAGSAWYFGEDPLPETVACASAWCAETHSLSDHLVTIWAVESALAPLAAAQRDALRGRYR
ncbi:MAG: thiaminase II/PqqC family protein, partial [Solirubrobacteraceae bacterium]